MWCVVEGRPAGVAAAAAVDVVLVRACGCAAGAPAPLAPAFGGVHLAALPAALAAAVPVAHVDACWARGTPAEARARIAVRPVDGGEASWLA